MGHADYLRKGDWNAICDRCGSKFKFSMLKKEWDGLYVCTSNRCWEPRQPQDYVKGIPDNMSVPISRPEAGNEFIQDVTVTEMPIVTIGMLKSISKYITIGVSSLVSLIAIYVPKPPPSKSPTAINGSAINVKTIG